MILCVLTSVRTFSIQPIPKIDKFLSEEFSSKDDGAVVLIARGDSVVYKKSFGDVKPDMIFQIASMTKQFTGAAIAQLAADNKLRLTDPIQKYIEYFPDKGKTITIEHLLSQTSGIPEYFDVEESDKDLLAKEYKPKDLIVYFMHRKLEFDPGSRFRYSNSNYVLLGAIIENVSGMSYHDYMASTFFKPLNLTNTSVWYDQSTTPDRIAKGHGDLNINGSVVYSAGGIVSTAEDLFTWNNSWVKSHLNLFQNKGYHYGLNVKDFLGSEALQHGGNLFGFTSSGIYLPAEEIYVCILSNSTFRGTEAIADYIASEMLGKPIGVPTKKLPVNSLEFYTGTYNLQNTERTMNVVLVSTVLVLTFPEQPGSSVDITPAGEDLFEAKKVKGKLKFVRNSDGSIKEVQVTQGKQTYIWIRK